MTGTPDTSPDRTLADRALAYRTLDSRSLVALLADLNDVRALLGGPPDDWRVSEGGDRNLNLVFIVDRSKGPVCVKPAGPHVRPAVPASAVPLPPAFLAPS